MHILICMYHNIKRLFEDRKGSYHARDGLKRDVGLPTYRMTGKKKMWQHIFF